MGRKSTVAEKLSAHIDRRGPDECWPWTGLCITQGYGQFMASGVKQYAHRAALEAALGRPLVAGGMACHHCDNPPCCNPAHLYEGNAQTNSDDMHARGRAVPVLGVERPDVTRRWIATLREQGHEAASVMSDEYAGWMAQMNADSAAVISRFVARVEAGECVDTETHWLDSVAAFVPSDKAEREWGLVA